MGIRRHATIGVIDLSCGEIQRIDIGDTSGAIDHAIGFRAVFGALICECYPQPAIRTLDPFHATSVLTRIPIRSLSA